MSEYALITECKICGRIPQKMYEETGHTHSVVPPEVSRLETVLDLPDDSTHAYCTSVTRLLKCPFCGTYYYHNHYEDRGEHFMDPTCDTVTVRRYDPLSALGFLRSVAGGSPDAMPATFDRMKKAFAEGAQTQQNHAGRAESGKQALAAAREAEELENRLEGLLDGLRERLRSTRPGLPADSGNETGTRTSLDEDWQIKDYLVNAVMHHLLHRNDYKAFRSELLAHPDPVVCLHSSLKLIGIGTGDAPAIDFAHMSSGLVTSVKSAMAGPIRMDELTGILLGLVFSPNSGDTFEYDHGYGASRSFRVRVSWVALYGLIVGATHGASLEAHIPALVRLLPTDKWRTNRLTWLLRTLAGRGTENARRVLAEPGKGGQRRRAKLSKDKDVQFLVRTCQMKYANPRTPNGLRPGIDET